MIRSRIALTTLAISTLGAPALARAEQPSPPADTVTIDGVDIATTDPAWDEYRWQLAHGGAPIRYWARVAKCETNSDWQDHGTWAGGLGIFTAKRFGQRGMGTWERWGGEQFALRPQGATALQQIVVANRIAVFGWKATYRDWNGTHQRVVQAHYWKRSSGFNGWGCIKAKRYGRQPGVWHINLNPSRWEAKRRDYWRDPIPYATHEVTLYRMNTPRWAKAKFANDPARLR